MNKTRKSHIPPLSPAQRELHRLRLDWEGKAYEMPVNDPQRSEKMLAAVRISNVFASIVRAR